MLRRALLHGDLSDSVLRGFYEVYNRLGGGLPEHVYLMALERELRWAGHAVARELGVPVLYKGEELTRLRIDAVVDGRLVVEAKATEVVPPGARRQLYNYLRCTPLEVGLLLHFGPEPRFYRVVCPNSRKRPLVAGACGETSPTDERVKADAPDTPERADGKPFPEYPKHPL
jgi:GxxExxY protein